MNRDSCTAGKIFLTPSAPVVKSGRKKLQETDSCMNSREDTVVSFRAY